MIRIDASIAIPDSEITVEFVRSSGPGGQNVNKVETAVQLRFDVRNSPSLPDGVKGRLAALAGKRITSEGILLLTARRFRTQARNREDALERLTALIRRAVKPPVPRRPTRPGTAAKERRLESKRLRARLKARRASARDTDP